MFASRIRLASARSKTESRVELSRQRKSDQIVRFNLIRKKSAWKMLKTALKNKQCGCLTSRTERGCSQLCCRTESTEWHSHCQYRSRFETKDFWLANWWWSRRKAFLKRYFSKLLNRLSVRPSSGLLALQSVPRSFSACMMWIVSRPVDKYDQKYFSTGFSFSLLFINYFPLKANHRSLLNLTPSRILIKLIFSSLLET